MPAPRPAMAGMEPPHCVPFAIGIDFDGLGLRLDAGAVHPPVVSLQGLSPGEEVSESLPAFAWSHAFLFEQAATGRIIVAMSLERRFTIDEIDAKVTRDGYSRCWFSRPTKRFFRKGAALLTVHRSRSGILRAYLGSLDDAAIVRALGDLRPLLGDFQYEWANALTLAAARLERRNINDFRDE